MTIRPIAEKRNRIGPIENSRRLDAERARCLTDPAKIV